MNKVNFTPAPGKVLIELVKDDKEESKIILPDQIKEGIEKAMQKPIGHIVALGPKCKYYLIGDLVEFSEHSGVAIQVDNKLYLLVHELEIYGKHN